MYSVPPVLCSIPPCTHADDPIPDALCYPRPTTCGLCGRDTASPSCTSCTTHDKHTLIGSSLYKHKRACQKGARPSSASCSHLLQPPSRESALHGRQRQYVRRRCGLPHHTFKRRLKAWAHGLEAFLDRVTRPATRIVYAALVGKPQCTARVGGQGGSGRRRIFHLACRGRCRRVTIVAATTAQPKDSLHGACTHSPTHTACDPVHECRTE